MFFEEKFREKIRRFNYKDVDIQSIIEGLKYYKLKGLHVSEQFIPSDYLYADVEQRWRLLRGFLNTTYIPENNDIEFGTISETLKDNIIELVQSLGGNAKCYISRYKKMSGKRTVPSILFYNIILHIPDADGKRFIKSIKCIGSEECQCIYISDPCHTYITDDYIITHNTTVARIITGFLYKYKYIEKNICIEVDGNFLVAGEQTALKTELLIRNAFGGVLFIDEAYALMSSYSGQEAIATIIKQMEDNRGKFILILAGYTNEMQALLNANPGFSSRIKEYLYFPDYSTYELGKIFMLMAKEKGFTVSSDAYSAFSARIDNEIQAGNFGNGRTARNILDEAIDKHALNYFDGVIPKSAQYEIMGADISPLPKNSNAM